MKFDKLKPGMFLASTADLDSWVLIKSKQINSVVLDEYWVWVETGYLYVAYDAVLEKNRWNQAAANKVYRLVITKDAQDLIVALFTRKRAKG